MPERFISSASAHGWMSRRSARRKSKLPSIPRTAPVGRFFRAFWIGSGLHGSECITDSTATLPIFRPRPEHLSDLQAILRNDPALWGGFAFDPDADRLATMGDKDVEISEEMTLVFCLRNLLEKVKSDVAVNLSTSMLIDDVATRFGVHVVRTKIGEANVVEGMERTGCLLGGEGNGGAHLSGHYELSGRSGGARRDRELMAKTGFRLSRLAAEWPAYVIVKTKIPLRSMDPVAAIECLAEGFSGETLDRQDGLKIIRPTAGFRSGHRTLSRSCAALLKREHGQRRKHWRD